MRGLKNFDLLARVEGYACAGQLGLDADRRLVVDEPAIDHGFAIGIGEDRIAEDLHGMQGRRGGEADLDRIEVLQHAAIFRDVVVLRAEFEFLVGHFAVQQIAAMALVDDHQIILVDGRRVGIVLREQHAFNEALNGANVHLGLGFWRNVIETLQAEDVGECLDAHDFGRAEFRLGLLAKRAAVDHKANPMKALRG